MSDASVAAPVPRAILDSIKKARQLALACDYATAKAFYDGLDEQIEKYVADLAATDGPRAPIVDKWSQLRTKLHSESGAIRELLRELDAFANAAAGLRIDREAYQPAPVVNNPYAVPRTQQQGKQHSSSSPNAVGGGGGFTRPPYRTDDDIDDVPPPQPQPVPVRARRAEQPLDQYQPSRRAAAAPALGDVNQALYGDRDRFGPPLDYDGGQPAMGFGVPPPLPNRKPAVAAAARPRPAPTTAAPAPTAAGGGGQPTGAGNGGRKPPVPKFKKADGGAAGEGKGPRAARYVPRPGEEEFATAIESEMTEPGSINVSFEDIAGQAEAKQALLEAVLFPIQLPDFHQGILRPPKGVLLYGPPGTGKSMLAKAVASMGNITFFNVSQATLTSKMRGDSEKLVRVLFEIAAHYSPSVVFIDEIESICTQRTADQNEASRRTLSVLLASMDGVSNSTKTVIVLGATNCPWDIDDAMRRRLEKRIYVPLPNEAESVEMFKILSRSLNVDPDVDFESLAHTCVENRFSGADLAILIREAAMQIPRRFLTDPANIEKLKKDKDAVQQALKELPVKMVDFATVIKKVSSSIAPETVKRFEQWKKIYEMS